ncbi:hypothetical protein [Marinomonas sp. 2405UD68-3]|uniref:hypothetical protein n=1 Tax=Marinomonas sp. 2405UD68-3 TaxID=3391835 RepID=UPI0039C8C7CA
MDLTALKNPVVLAILAGFVIVTNVVTYNVSAPAADDANLERALRPLEGLNENLGGGLNWNESIR